VSQLRSLALSRLRTLLKESLGTGNGPAKAGHHDALPRTGHHDDRIATGAVVSAPGRDTATRERAAR
jgi:hypothetical protein